MQRVHYFQRFSKPEDVATNNTLLLFKRVQHHDPRLFQGILQEVVSTDDLVIGAELSEQETTKSSIVDGVIRQRSFHVVLETKRHASFSIPQEPANLGAAESALIAFSGKHKRSVRLAWTTFARLIEICRDIVPEHERETIELIDDYEDFCDGEGLLASSDADLLVVGCSQSINDNLDLQLYYDPKKSHRPAKYIGFYQDKAVRAIGLLGCVVRADLNGKSVETSEGPDVADEQRTRIREAMRRAPAYGWNIEHGCYFFIADEVEKTNFRKATKYPLWSRRYFDLREVLNLNAKDKMPDLKTLASRLRNVTW